jgi:TonB family protein
MSNSGSKVLRVGLVRDGRVVKEELFRKHQSITIGTAEQCTFQLDIEGLPPIYPLIRYQNQSYNLQFTPSMDGALMVSNSMGGSQLHRFEELVHHERVSPQGELYTISMEPQMRGKVQVGPFTLLFQFVTPPPPTKVAPLPASYRRFSLQNFDWNFAYIFLASLILQGAPALYLSQLPVVEVKSLKKANREKFLAIVKEKRKVQQQKLKVIKKKDPVVSKKKTSTQKLPEPTTPDKRRARRVAIKNNLMKTTALGAVAGGVGIGLDPESNDLINNAFDGVGLASTRGAGGGGGRGSGLIGSAQGDVAGIDDGELVGQRRAKKRAIKKVERKIKSKLKVQAADDVVGIGKLSPSQINRVVRRNSKRLQGCYESELKKNRKLEGVIKVRFTIETNGRISSTRVIQNTMGSSAVAGCIQNRIKRWRFKNKPQGGSVTVAYPFFFTPSN